MCQCVMCQLLCANDTKSHNCVYRLMIQGDTQTLPIQGGIGLLCHIQNHHETANKEFRISSDFTNIPELKLSRHTTEETSYQDIALYRTIWLTKHVIGRLQALSSYIVEETSSTAQLSSDMFWNTFDRCESSIPDILSAILNAKGGRHLRRIIVLTVFVLDQ